MWKKIEDTVKTSQRFMTTTCVDGLFCARQLSLILIDEEEVKKHLTSHSKADASMKLMALRPKGQCKLTTVIKGCLPSTYRVYKEITCSPRLVKPKGIPIGKGSRKIRPKRLLKGKGF